MEQRIKSSAKVKGQGAKYQGKVTTLRGTKCVLYSTCDLIQLLIWVGRRDNRLARSADSDASKIMYASRCPTTLKRWEAKARWSWTENMVWWKKLNSFQKCGTLSLNKGSEEYFQKQKNLEGLELSHGCAHNNFSKSEQFLHAFYLTHMTRSEGS